MKVEFINGQLTLLLSSTEDERIVTAAAEQYAAKLAEQQALSKVYDVAGLQKRLEIGRTTAYELCQSGRLRSTCLGKKAYRVTEQAVREYLGDVTQKAA